VKKILMLAMVLGLLVSNICYAQSAKEAIRALQKLQTRVEVGISYRDYAPALGDTKFEVNLFLKSPEAKDKKELALKIERCLTDHQLASSVWNLYFTKLRQGLVMRDSRGAIIEARDIQNLTTTFPELIDVIQNRSIQTSFFSKKSGYIWLSDVLSVIWKDAGKSLGEATNLLSDQSQKTSIPPKQEMPATPEEYTNSLEKEMPHKDPPRVQMDEHGNPIYVPHK
jgi:hypothetical protein